MNKLRIMLAEDHETVREGLKMIVNAEDDMEVTGVAGDGLEAIAQAQQLLPDVLVMDISMPKINGLKATQRLKEVCPQVKVLTLSRHADDGYVRALLGAGARGYVLKQSASTELIHAIRSVADGGTVDEEVDPADSCDPRRRRRRQIHRSKAGRQCHRLLQRAEGCRARPNESHFERPRVRSFASDCSRLQQ